MTPMNEGDRRRQHRYKATLKASFKFAGRRHFAITTEVSPAGATIVAPVRLPTGAILIFDIEEGSDENHPDVRGVRLIGQVAWSGPAPFGGGQDFAAGIELLRAIGESWGELLHFLKLKLRAESAPRHRSASGSYAAVDLRQRAAARVRRSTRFEALFNNDGVWFRGEIVTANPSTLWLRTSRMAPRPGAPIRVRIAVRDQGKLVAVDLRGQVPGSAIPDPSSRGWVFEVEVDEINRTDLYSRLLAAIQSAGDKA